MEKYIALLRGINVSGKNKVSMPILKEAFEKKGFSKVKTYINSGNVLFSSENTNQEVLTHACEALIAETFDLEISVIVFTVKELSGWLKEAPEWWNQEKQTIHYMIFAIPPMTVSEVVDTVGEIRPAYEKISHQTKVIFWSAPRETFNKARWSKIASSSVNPYVTIRNANTVTKLVELSKQMNE